MTLTGDELSRHLHIIGKSGSGKSTAINAIIVQHIMQGRGVSLIDPHGDLAVLVMQTLMEQGYFKRESDFERIMYVDFGHPTRIPPMNVLKMPYDDDEVASELARVCLRIWPNLEGVGVTFLNIIKYSAYALIQAGLPLPAMQPFLTDQAFRRMVLTHAKDPQIVRFFATRFDKWKDQTEKNESTQNRLDLFSFSPRMRAMFSQRENLFSYGSIMQSGRCAIYNLSALDEERNAFVAAFLFRGYERAARARAAINEDARVPHYLFGDEFQNFTGSNSKSFEDMLSGARKFRLFLGLAHQNFGQMDDRLKQALENAESIAFKLNRADAVWMAPRFAHYNEKQIKHKVEDKDAQERSHPVFSSITEQFEKRAHEFENLPRGHCFTKFGSTVRRISTVPFPKPHVSDAAFLTLTEKYAERYLVPMDTPTEPLAHEEAPTTVYRATSLQRRVRSKT